MNTKTVEDFAKRIITRRRIDTGFIVRDYRTDDFANLSNLWSLTDQAYNYRADNARTIRRSIRLGGKLLVLVEQETKIICGSAWMTFDGRRIHLHHFGILPEFQGRGLSKNLLKEALEFVKTKGCQVKIEVHQANYKAINLYKKAGFAYLGDFDVYIIRDLSKIVDL
jgi:ribosomal protein S18 acetylase RimI-like enzyme